LNVVWPIEKPLHGSLLLTIIIFGCANVNSEYERVSRIDTVETYKSFLDKHPGSEFELRAKQRIEELEKEEQARKEKIAWQDAKEQNSVSSYVNFIKSYPKSKFVVDAKSAINTLIIEVALTNAGDEGTEVILPWQTILRRDSRSG
jgi:outer membrane protein assembly factor BamD (BamD/ComL family)